MADLRVNVELRGRTNGDAGVGHGFAAHWNGSIGRSLRWGHHSGLHGEGMDVCVPRLPASRGNETRVTLRQAAVGGSWQVAETVNVVQSRLQLLGDA